MKKRMKSIEFKVSFILPPSATIADAEAYLYDAVGTMKGCYRPPNSINDKDPGDPMWDLDSTTLKVVKLRDKLREKK